MNIRILSVNYNTPHNISTLINSYHKYGYDKYPLTIVDGSDSSKQIQESKKIQTTNPHIIFDYIGYNIHHGPGLHYGIKNYPADYILLVDSDLQFVKEGYIELCLKYVDFNTYGVGKCEEVNSKGFNVKKGIKYLHPNGCLINSEMYFKYKPLIAHGAPFINTMIELDRKNLSHILTNINDVFSSYINRGRQGTVKYYGYGANLYVKLNKKFGLI